MCIYKGCINSPSGSISTNHGTNQIILMCSLLYYAGSTGCGIDLIGHALRIGTGHAGIHCRFQLRDIGFVELSELQQMDNESNLFFIFSLLH